MTGAREIGDLPFAAALMPHRGGLAPGGEYDCAHFDRACFDEPGAGGSRFLECAFTGVTVTGGQLRKARFTGVWMRDVRLISAGLAQTEWADTTISGGVIAGAEAFGARLRRVALRGCKLDSVNLRDAELADVTFDNCVLRDVDFTGATLSRTAFPGSRLAGVTFRQVTLDKADLRGAELGLIAGPASLRGAIVTSGQLVAMAPLLAESIGIIVDDQ